MMNMALAMKREAMEATDQLSEFLNKETRLDSETTLLIRNKLGEIIEILRKIIYLFCDFEHGSYKKMKALSKAITSKDKMDTLDTSNLKDFLNVIEGFELDFSVSPFKLSEEFKARLNEFEKGLELDK